MIFIAAVSVCAVIIGGINAQLRYWSLVVAFGSAVAGIMLVLRHTVLLLRRNYALLDRCERRVPVAVASEIHAWSAVLRRVPECSVAFSSSYSMRFVNLQVLLDVLDKHSPERALEFGSGMSTVCVASWLKSRGKGRICSFEHDVEWAHTTQEFLHRAGLSGFAEIRIAPLVERECHGHTISFYDIGKQLEEMQEVDLAIIDGPPAKSSQNGMSRLPALDVLRPCLADSAVILLDDACKVTGKMILDIWRTVHPEFEIRIIESITGIAILRRATQRGRSGRKGTAGRARAGERHQAGT